MFVAQHRSDGRPGPSPASCGPNAALVQYFGDALAAIALCVHLENLTHDRGLFGFDRFADFHNDRAAMLVHVSGVFDRDAPVAVKATAGVQSFECPAGESAITGQGLAWAGRPTSAVG